MESFRTSVISSLETEAGEDVHGHTFCSSNESSTSWLLHRPFPSG